MGMASYCVYYISFLQSMREITTAEQQIRWALRLQIQRFYKFIPEPEVSQVKMDFNATNYEIAVY